MCLRDDVRRTRWCTFCGNEYYGDLGHRNCPGFSKKPESSPGDKPASTESRPTRRKSGRKGSSIRRLH